MPVPTGRMGVFRATSANASVNAFESDARVEQKCVVDQGGCDFVDKESEDIEMGAHIDERDFWLLVGGEAARRVKRDCIPHEFRLRFRIAMSQQNAARRISTVHFEALVCGKLV